MEAADWAGAIGETWAEEWPRTDRALKPVGEALVAAAARCVANGAPSRILDIGCGAGSTSIALSRVLPGAYITGIDLSSALVAAACVRAATAEHCAFEVADAASWTGGDGFELLVSRHGIMFFADPAAALGHLRARAVPDAPFVFSCFRDPALNPWASAVAALVPDAAPGEPDAPGPFAFADHERVARLLTEAGWKAAEAAPLDFAYVAGAGEDPVADAVGFFRRIGPTAHALRGLVGEARKRLLDGLEGLSRAHLADGRVTFPAAAWIWSARA